MVSRRKGANMITIDQIKQFCGSIDTKRHNIHLPWSREEYSYATNGHVIIRIPRHPEINENPDAPDAAKLFSNTLPPGEYIDIPQLPEPILSNCSVCRGTGRIAGEPNWIECKECDNGKIAELQKITIQGVIFEVIFNVEYLRKISKLPNAKIAVVNNTEKPSWFKF